MKKLIYLLFFKTVRFWETVSDDNLSVWKALIILGGAQGLLLIELLVWVTICTKKAVDFSKYWLILPGLFITIINYYLFLHHDRWKEYDEEFANYSNNKNRLVNLSVVLFFLLVLGSLILSFYRMSLIDWSKYR